MSISPTGIGDIWRFYDPFRSARNRVAPSAAPSAPVSQTSPAELRQQLVASSNALREAFKFLSANLRRVMMPTLEGSPGSKALARATFVPASTFSVLRTTREINEIPSAVRSSMNPLGLDVTSPETFSRLQSTAGVGLDVTSAERSTVLASNSTLGLDTATPEASSVIQSTAEANTMATSYGAVQARFGSSTSLGKISGVYAGTGAAANATSLTLTVSALTRDINSIPNLVRVSVRDQNGASLGSYQATVVAGDPLSLGTDIGLSVSFGSGTIENGSSATFSVSRTTPTDVDPNAIFNAADINYRPRFENGAQVSAGSFQVNGTSVAVLANDSINSVLQRINQTVAGVSASYENDRVVIRSSGPSEDNILLSNDTSGFFNALKLTAATTTRGNVRDDLQALSKTSQFATVSSGTFQVNGQTISIDRSVDSIASIVARINSAAAGVNAAYDAQSDRIVLTSNAASEDPIILDNDTTGFLSLAALDTSNSVLGNIRDDRQVLSKVAAFSAVTNGSFQVNGVDISVDIATDTVESILQRINASGAGVTAAYDSTGDKFTFTTNAISEDEILLANDSSGFLSSAQLSGAMTDRGNIRDDNQALGTLPQFSSVTAGSFTVNGVAINIDPATDSLNSIIARINSSVSGVTASYDSLEGRLVLDPGNNALVLDDDSTGFLQSAGIDLGTFATRVNPLTAFNGTGMNSPHFDPGVSVQAGSFTLNNVEITVNADDSIMSVLERINASSAGVTASFDAATETIRLQANQPGPQQIVFGSDSSGFLAAVKLENSTDLTTGSSASEMLLRESLPTANGGVIEINQQLITIDPDADTLASLAQKLDALEGVEAFLDEETGALSIRSEVEGGSLTIADYSGALAALGITDGIYEGEASTLRTVHAKTSRFQLINRDKVVDRLMESFETLNQALDLSQKVAGLSLGWRDDLQDAVRDALASISDARTRGLSVRNDAESGFGLNAERSLIAHALRQNARVLDDFFKGKSNLPDALQELAANVAASVPVSAVAPNTSTPAPTAQIAGDKEQEYYEVASASQLFIIDSASRA